VLPMKCDKAFQLAAIGGGSVLERDDLRPQS
jgi:hypothetical protein